MSYFFIRLKREVLGYKLERNKVENEKAEIRNLKSEIQTYLRSR